MQLETQVVSLELAKKLKEIGIRQQSLFYWMECGHSDGISYINYIDDFCDTHNIADGTMQSFAAFTATELGEMLPNTLLEIDDQDEYSEPDARAKMLIYLIENRLMEILI